MRVVCQLFALAFLSTACTSTRSKHIWDMGPRGGAGPASLAVAPAPQQAAPTTLEEYEKGLDANDAPPGPGDDLPQPAPGPGTHGVAALPRGRPLVKEATLNDLEDGAHAHHARTVLC